MPTTTPLVYTTETACQALACSRAHLYRLLSTKQIRAKRDRGRLVITAAELQRYLDELPDAEFTPPAPSPADRDPATADREE